MASNASFGRRGATLPQAANAKAGRPALSTGASALSGPKARPFPWRLIGLGIMLCLLAVFLTQPEPFKSIAKWTAMAMGAGAFALNTWLAKNGRT